MFRSAPQAFFRSGTIARITANVAHTPGIQYYSIWRAFDNVKDNTKEEVKIRSRIAKLDEEVKKIEKTLAEKQNKLRKLDHTHFKLQEPCSSRELALSKLDEIANILISCIYDLKLQGQRECSVPLSRVADDKEALLFFKPILEQNQINYTLEEHHGQGEIYYKLFLNLPDQIYIKPIKVSANKECGRWVNNFVHNLQTALTNAENKIEQDYQKLKSTLLDRIVQDHQQAFIQFNPAPVALERFRKELEIMNVQLIQKDGLICTEYLESYSSPTI